jgi:Ulp1 family protease
MLFSSDFYEYVHSFHWILLIIMIDHNNVLVFDSLRKDLDDYKNL